MNPSTRLSLLGTCTNCDGDVSLEYQWSDISTPHQINFDTDTLTTRISSNLVVKAGSFIGGLTYKYSLKIAKRSGKIFVSVKRVKSDSVIHWINIFIFSHFFLCFIFFFIFSFFVGFLFVSNFHFSFRFWFLPVWLPERKLRIK